MATGNLLTGTATPRGTLDSVRGLVWERVDEVVTEWRPGRLVVGLPGGDFAQEALQFADELNRRYGLPVVTTDENLTSHAAMSQLREARASGLMKRRVSKGDIDSHAACVIAEQWMGSQA